jgi:hypothetical protein
MREHTYREPERLDIKLASEIVVWLNFRHSPRVLSGRILVRIRLSPASGVTPEQLRHAFKKVAAFADIENARLVIDLQDLNDGEAFRIDLVETGKKE